MIRIVITTLIALLLVSCDIQHKSDGSDIELAAVNGENIRSHIEILAADDMQGREAGTAGYDKAAAYVASMYRDLGLEPLNDRGDYFQPIEFLETRLQLDSADLVFHRGDETINLILADDYVRAGGYGPANETVTAPLVFAGHGITAPEYDHNDFDGVDVDGKILLVLSGAPPGFDTDQRAFYSSGLTKRNTAARLGAVGLVTVRTPVDQQRQPWDRFVSGLGTTGMRWIDANGQPHHGFPELIGTATLSESGANNLFEFSKHDLNGLFESHAAGKTGSFDMGLTASFAATSAQRTVRSANVLGMLRGSDPVLQNEYVVFTAHLDHLGIRPGDDGDEIHNGAYDNAAGVAVMLEVAKAMTHMEAGPKRSIIFAAVTAEEKGLQGSGFFANNPPVPVEDIVANINIDMPYLAFPVSDIEAFGAEHSTLLAAIEWATGQTGMELTQDPMPERVRFVRSDQFSFVQQGVPALAFKAGSLSSDPAIDGTAMLKDFLENHYHRGSDDLDLKFNAEGAERFSKTALLLGLYVADHDARPEWNDGDFFGDRFSR